MVKIDLIVVLFYSRCHETAGGHGDVLLNVALTGAEQTFGSLHNDLAASGASLMRVIQSSLPLPSKDYRHITSFPGAGHLQR